MAIDKSGALYAMGGFDQHYNLDIVDRYDAAKNEWTPLAPLPAPRLCGMAQTRSDGTIFFFGGATTKVQNTIYSYSPDTNIGPSDRSHECRRRVVHYRWPFRHRIAEDLGVQARG